MTEDEARKKWCPMSRQMHGEIGLVYNRRVPGHIEEGTHCITSDCMMWRNHADDYAEGFEDQAPEGGYCGLGGKP